MGAGVHHGEFFTVVGQIGTLPQVVKGKDQHLHAGDAAGAHKFQRVGIQVAQVLGDELQLRSGALESFQQLHARAGLPVALLGGLRVGGDGPIGVEGAEVVDADGVVEPGTPGDALPPEVEDLLFIALPVIQGVAPELAVGGEGVRGHAGHIGQMAVLIQLEQLRVGPAFHAVGGEIEGDVAHDADVLLVGVLL